jgi:hypothetical protein
VLRKGIGLAQEHHMADRINPSGKQPGEKPEGMYNPGNQSGKQAGMADELIDALNAADPIQSESPVDRVRSATRRLSEANAAGDAAIISLETLAGLVRQAPLQCLAIAFMLGVVVARRR